MVAKKDIHVSWGDVLIGTAEINSDGYIFIELLQTDAVKEIMDTLLNKVNFAIALDGAIVLNSKKGR